MITSPHLYGAEAGKTFIYKKNGQDNWEFDQELTPKNDVVQDSYGWSIAMNENEIIVGASRDDLDSNEENEMQDAGSAYIFNQTNLTTNENGLPINDEKSTQIRLKILSISPVKKEFHLLKS